MAFDKGAFRAFVKEQFALAANPTFKPQPDAEIKDDAQREAKHAEAVARAASAREAAIVDVAAHAAANLVSQRYAELWPAGAAGADFDVASLLESAAAALDAGASGEQLADAAVLLLIASFTKLIRE